MYLPKDYLTQRVYQNIKFSLLELNNLEHPIDILTDNRQLHHWPTLVSGKQSKYYTGSDNGMETSSNS